MSSDETASSNSEDEESCPLVPHAANKTLVKKRASWRSQEFQDYIACLDRKVDRRRSDRAKQMALAFVLGEDSSRSAPDGCPEWAMTLFN